MEGRTTFARRLKEARKQTGISQYELGVRAGFDPSGASARMNQYERGKHVPDLLTAQRMAAQLGVPASYFFESDDDLAALLMMAGQLPRTKRRELVEQLRGWMAGDETPSAQPDREDSRDGS